MANKKKLAAKIHRIAHTQHRKPGLQTRMKPKPKSIKASYQGSGKLLNKVAIITGGDSGIGRAISVYFAKEGADIVIVYLNEHADAIKTKEMVEKEGRACILIEGNLQKQKFCQTVITKTLKQFKKIDILVNNAAEQHPQDDILKITAEQLQQTFATNIFSFFYMAQAVLPHLKRGGTIINTTSVTSYRGSEHLVDYSATKGAIVAFTRSLALNLAKKGIRVNGVAPGPIWTPLIESTFSKAHIKKFGSNVPMGRPGQPDEVAPAYVFLASDDASYMTGQVLHPNGGEIVNT